MPCSPHAHHHPGSLLGFPLPGPPSWEGAARVKDQRVGTCSNMMPFWLFCGLYPGWGMALSTDMRC